MKLRVELDWRTTLATALLLPTLLSLGFWQLDRADEKAALIELIIEATEAKKVAAREEEDARAGSAAARISTRDEPADR